MLECSRNLFCSHCACSDQGYDFTSTCHLFWLHCTAWCSYWTNLKQKCNTLQSMGLIINQCKVWNWVQLGSIRRSVVRQSTVNSLWLKIGWVRREKVSLYLGYSNTTIVKLFKIKYFSYSASHYIMSSLEPQVKAPVSLYIEKNNSIFEFDDNHRRFE